MSNFKKILLSFIAAACLGGIPTFLYGDTPTFSFFNIKQRLAKKEIQKLLNYDQKIFAEQFEEINKIEGVGNEYYDKIGTAFRKYSYDLREYLIKSKAPKEIKSAFNDYAIASDNLGIIYLNHPNLPNSEIGYGLAGLRYLLTCGWIQGKSEILTFLDKCINAGEKRNEMWSIIVKISEEYGIKFK